MNRLLLVRTTLVIAILLVLSCAAVAQTPSCAYTFTWPKYEFSFCVSQYATLSMLQAPIGVNHLDPATPIEGYVYYYDIEGNNNYFGGCQVPNILGGCLPQVGSFSQPNGPGTLPLIADDGVAKTTFTANPSERQVIILTAVDIGVYRGAHLLVLEREGVFQPGVNATFSGTGFGPYAVSNYGVRITTNTQSSCFGNYSGIPTEWNADDGADPCFITNFTGDGTMFAESGTSSPRFVNLQVEYSVF
jgi:hypothetical protein